MVLKVAVYITHYYTCMSDITQQTYFLKSDMLIDVEDDLYKKLVQFNVILFSGR